MAGIYARHALFQITDRGSVNAAVARAVSVAVGIVADADALATRAGGIGDDRAARGTDRRAGQRAAATAGHGRADQATGDSANGRTGPLSKATKATAGWATRRQRTANRRRTRFR